MNCRIVAVSGPRCGLEFALPSRENFVGRDPSNTIQVDHLSVSRNHCVIRRSGEEWTVRDLESRNGTFVNRIPVRERVLRPGDELQVGDCVFLFLPEAAPERTGPLPPEPLAQGDVTRTLVLRPEDSRYLTPGKVDAELAADAANRGARLARELDALLSISVSIHSLRGVEAISHRLLEAAMEVTPACRGAVWLPACSFAWQRDNGPIEAPAELSALIAGAAQEQAAMLSEVSSAPGTMAATAPILCFGNILGVLAVQGSAGSPLNADHLQLLRAIAVIAGPALDHAAHLAVRRGGHFAIRHAVLGAILLERAVVRSKGIDSLQRVLDLDPRWVEANYALARFYAPDRQLGTVARLPGEGIGGDAGVIGPTTACAPFFSTADKFQWPIFRTGASPSHRPCVSVERAFSRTIPDLSYLIFTPDLSYLTMQLL
ncbi:MAG: FHA domain-containing protein [Bryobacterales bacterium]|nr:FHA domain-containing protein [Bryobacterales bacterium]